MLKVVENSESDESILDELAREGAWKVHDQIPRFDRAPILFGGLMQTSLHAGRASAGPPPTPLRGSLGSQAQILKSFGIWSYTRVEDVERRAGIYLK